MQSAYHIDSDDDEEEVAPINVPKSATGHVHQLDKLKSKTTELLDPTWRNERNKVLLKKMLDLEEPTVTAKMVDFLLQEGVCNTLMGYITQVGTKQPRPSPTDNQSDALRLAYRAVMLLTADDPTEALMAFLSKRVTQLARGIFDIYRDDSSASFYHGYRMLECLLRSFPGETYDSICSDEHLGSRIRDMLRYIGYAPVGETISMLIALTPVPRSSQLYSLSSKSRWQFFERLNRLSFMQLLIDVIVNPESKCYIQGGIGSEQHSSCATFVLQELVEKLSVEDIGELLLQPFGYTPTLLDALVEASLHGTIHSIRRSCTKLLCFLLRRVADAEIMYIVSTGPGSPPAPAYVPNRLYPLRDRIIALVRGRILEFMQMLLNSAHSSTDTEAQAILGPMETRGPVTYSAYTIPQPFTVLRSIFLELLTLMVESDDTVAELISPDLWRVLMHWTIQYAQNSIFHAIFYRLIFSVLRQDDETAQRNLLQKAKFVSFIVDNFVPHPMSSADLPGKKASELVQNKFVARGVLMNCANAIRLQANSLPSTAFLRQFLGSHQKWVEFLPLLNASTEIQQNYAFGVKVPEHKGGITGERGMMGSLIHSTTPATAIGLGEDGIDSDVQHLNELDAGMTFGSRYAKSLGFVDCDNNNNNNSSNNNNNNGTTANSAAANGHNVGAASHSDAKKKKKAIKKKAKKRKGKVASDGSSSSGGDGEEEDEDDENSEDSDSSSGSEEGLDGRVNESRAQAAASKHSHKTVSPPGDREEKEGLQRGNADGHDDMTPNALIEQELTDHLDIALDIIEQD